MKEFARARQSLITRHRPERFSELVGMPNISQGLAKTIERGDIPNAFLLEGNSGCGKTTIARIIAKAVMCDNGTACGECPSCKTPLNNHMDYHEINCGTNGKVDDIRSMLMGCDNMPQIGRMRVYVLDEVHNLTGASAEAMLKPIEEPSSSTLWILCTTEAGRLKETLRNRCNLIKVRPADCKELSRYLTRLIYSEAKVAGLPALRNKEVAMLVGRSIANQTGGYIRESLSLMEMLITSLRGRDSIPTEQEELESLVTELLNESVEETVVSAQKIVQAVLTGKIGMLANELANCSDGYGTIRQLLIVSQYWFDRATRAKGREVYHPPYLRNGYDEFSKANPNIPLKAIVMLLSAVTDMTSRASTFMVAERPLMTSTLSELLYRINDYKKSAARGSGND